jgi:CheY-like chemotaxis protein
MKHSLLEQPLVLVVDDDQTVLDDAAAILTAVGCQCQCCSTPEAALAATKAAAPDLMLLDTSLPGLSGAELHEQIRQEQSLAEVPVMFLSSAQGPDIIRRHNGTNGAYYLRKPLDGGVLTELVDKALARRPELTPSVS